MMCVQKLFQRQCLLNNHGIYLYKTNAKQMTNHYCTLCINILEIHKPVLLQFRLLSGVVIDTVLKMVRKRIENVAENRGYVKICCKLGLNVKSIHDVLFMGIIKCHFPQFISGLQNSIPVRNQSRCSLFRKTQVCSYQI